MKATKEQLLSLQKNGFSLSFETILEKTFANYKKIALYSGSFLLVFSVLFSFVLFVGLANYFGVKNIVAFLKPEYIIAQSKNPNFILANGLISIALGTFFYPFTASFVYMAKAAAEDIEFKIHDFFIFYKKPKLLPLTLAGFIISLINVVLSFALDYIGVPLLGTLASVLLSVYSLLTIPLLLFSDLQAISAIKVSFILVSKQTFVILALFFIAIITIFLGLFGFLVGVFFTLPIMYSLQYCLYTSIFDTNNPK